MKLPPYLALYATAALLLASCAPTVPPVAKPAWDSPEAMHQANVRRITAPGGF